MINLHRVGRLERTSADQQRLTDGNTAECNILYGLEDSFRI